MNLHSIYMNDFMSYNWISKLNKYPTILSLRDHGDLLFCQYGIQRALCRDEEAKNEICEESRRNKRLSPSGCLLERSNRYEQLDLLRNLAIQLVARSLGLFCPCNDAIPSHEENAAWSQRRLDISNYGHLCNLPPPIEDSCKDIDNLWFDEPRIRSFYLFCFVFEEAKFVFDKWNGMDDRRVNCVPIDYGAMLLLHFYSVSLERFISVRLFICLQPRKRAGL